MPVNWGPNVNVSADDVLSGTVTLTETYDEKGFERTLRLLDDIADGHHSTNEWAQRPVGTKTWIKIGESNDPSSNFAVPFDTTQLPNGPRELLARMSITVEKTGKTFTRECVVGVFISNQ